MNTREKIKHIYFYHKWTLLFIILFFIAFLFFLKDFLERRAEADFYIMVLEKAMDDEDVDVLESQLKLALNLDEDDELVIESSYTKANNPQSEATVSTYMQVGLVDILIAPEYEFNRYAASNYLTLLEGDEFQIPLERRFFAKTVDYSQGGAIREIPLNPHMEEEANCYGFYIDEGAFSGYVIGILQNAPHTIYTQKALIQLLCISFNDI